MKKAWMSLLLVTITIMMLGCGAKENKTEQMSEATLGGRLANTFLAEIEKSTDLEAVANTISEGSGYDCLVMPVSEGYLNGFSEEITGFQSGVQFAPMIGSIPFVGYVFEVEDPDAFKEKLLSVADPRWNICTEAAETVSVTSGKYVFFTMCPDEEEQ